MGKKLQIEKLAKQIRVCKKCRLSRSRKIAVPGEGNPSAKVIFLGEAPGNFEDLTGRPFVGSSGKFLDKLLVENNLRRKDFFISSVVKCHPPQNRNPRVDELLTCEDWWRMQIKIIKPKIIVLLGKVALKEVLRRDDLSACHGKKIVKDGMAYFPTFHPAAGRRFPALGKKMAQDFERLSNLIF
jgi:DNA polymerase